jgi:hypothetical protein
MRLAVVLLAVAGAAAGPGPAAGTCRAADLEYHWPSGQEFAYIFDVDADFGDHLEHVSGASIYKPSPAGAATRPATPVSGTGTAFVVADGVLATCAHVVQDATKISVQVNQKRLPGRVLAVNRAADLALLRVDEAGLSPLPLGDSDRVELTEEVRVVGYPLADVLGSSIKVTTGTLVGTFQRRGHKLLQVDAAINPGNSGGPVVDARGAVIGIASAKLAGQQISNVGFAVPVNDLKRLMQSKGVAGQQGQGASLAGPELARRVTPSVFLVSVTLGPGEAPGEAASLAFRGWAELSQRPKSESRPAPKQVVRTEHSDGRLVVDARGDVVHTENLPLLPYALGLQGLVGIERLPNADQETWHVERVIVVGVGEKHVDFPGAPEPERHPQHSSKMPVIERIDYDLSESKLTDTVVLTKRYELRTADRPGAKPKLQVVGDASVQFDTRLGMPRSMRFSGSLSLTTPDETQVVPLTFTYKRADPATLTAGSTGARHGGTGVRPGGPPADRLPLPDAAARTKAEAAVQEVFGSQVSAARTVTEKQALVAKLIQAAAEEGNPAHRFVLLNKARTVAVGAGDVWSARHACEEIVQGYDIDPAQANRATLRALARGTNAAQNVQLAQWAAALVEDAAAARDFPAAAELCEAAVAAARKAENADLLKRLVRRSREIQKIVRGLEAVRPQREALAKDPKDPAANLAVGQHYAFVERNWDDGLPLLARGSDAALKAAAGKDLAAPADAAGMLQIGDRWWDLAEAAEGEAQEALRTRALHWYKEAQALPDLAGLERKRIEKRLHDYADLVAEPPAPEKTEAVAGPARSSAGKRGAERRLVEYATARIAAKQTVSSKVIGWTLNTTEFSTVPEQGALLVGIDLSFGTFNKIVSIRPLFLTAKGLVPGPVIGRPTAATVRLMARKGYAVGFITVNAGLGIDGLNLGFMKIESGGLNPDDSYESAWMGKHGKDVQLGGKGLPVVGIKGHYTEKIEALGVVLVEKAKDQG